mmetsp:Transcript_3475/g.11630  ORF Transcript_3475/g.11630 Transcript_3475/m.11630 type:complete len:270 (+) Transcript_3475:373-1182(+)
MPPPPIPMPPAMPAICCCACAICSGVTSRPIERAIAAMSEGAIEATLSLTPAIICCACALKAGSAISASTSLRVFGSFIISITPCITLGSRAACCRLAMPSSAVLSSPALCRSAFRSSHSDASLAAAPPIAAAPPGTWPIAVAVAMPGTGLPWASSIPRALALASSSASLALAAFMYCGSLSISAALAITSGSFMPCITSCILSGLRLSCSQPAIAMSTSEGGGVASAMPDASPCILLRRPNWASAASGAQIRATQVRRRAIVASGRRL